MKLRIDTAVTERVAALESEQATSHRDLTALLASRNLVKEGGLVESVRAIIDERDALVAPAAEGKQYREDLKKEALDEGVRAFPDFKRDVYAKILETADLDVVKQMRNDWKATADRVFPGGAHVRGDDTSAVRRDDNPNRHRA
jgi:hypothetical protein